MKKLTAILLCAAALCALCACQGTTPPPQTPTEAPVQTQTEQPATAAPTEAPVQTPTDPAGVTVSGDMDPYNRTWTEMQTADFWIALCEEPQAVRMTEEEIDAWHEALPGVSGVNVEDLSAWPESLSRVALLDLLSYYDPTPSGDYFTPSGAITTDQQQAMNENRNEHALADQNPVRYGFVVENALLRTYPSSISLYDYFNDYEYDKSVETAFKVWEPVLVLHTSADGEWLLVRAYDYLGWIRTEQVALCSRDQWDRLRADMKEDYVTVLGPRVAMDGSFDYAEQHTVILKMGTVLPLVPGSNGADNACDENCYIVRLPLREKDGQLKTVTARLPKSEDVTEGCLPYTTENVLRQAFKLLGHRYGWGGMVEGWDCSSICQDVYRTVGLFIPRNSGNQRQLPGNLAVNGVSASGKQMFLNELLPGAMLELPGHQTMYIGTFNGESYVIHSTHGVYDQHDRFYNANAVIVSSVNAYRSNGLTLMDNFRGFSVPACQNR